MAQKITPHMLSLKIQAYKALPKPSQKTALQEAYQACAVDLDAEIKDHEQKAAALKTLKASLRKDLTEALKGTDEPTME